MSDLKVVAMLRKYSFFHVVVTLAFSLLVSFVWGAGDFFSLRMKITFSLVSIVIVSIPLWPDNLFVSSKEFEEREQK